MNVPERLVRPDPDPPVTTLVRRALLRYPLPEARRRIVASLLERFASSDEYRLQLSAPVFLPGLGTEIVLNRAVSVVIRRPGDEEADAYPVAWDMEGNQRFPRFIGRVTLAPHDETSSWLQIEGTYERRPASLRFTEPGELAIGRRIATATGRMLLDRLIRLAGSIR